MPELPEVETICQKLAKELLGKSIVNTQYRRANLRQILPDNIDVLNQQPIQQIQRRAKYIQIFCGSKQVMLLHLGMTGKLFFAEDNYQPTTHDHVIFSLSDQRQLIYQDIRRFGLITVCSAQDLPLHPLLQNLGIEPLTTGFDAQYLQQKLCNKTMKIKPALMDNKVVVGVGNIYACESLFRSKIAPTRAANSLDLAELTRLVANIKQVLLEAIKAGGSTVRNYSTPDQLSGLFQMQLQVYGQVGKPCQICQHSISRIKQAGRSTFWCGKCQV